MIIKTTSELIKPIDELAVQLDKKLSETEKTFALRMQSMLLRKMLFQVNPFLTTIDLFGGYLLLHNPGKVKRNLGSSNSRGGSSDEIIEASGKNGTILVPLQMVPENITSIDSQQNVTLPKIDESNIPRAALVKFILDQLSSRITVYNFAYISEQLKFDGRRIFYSSNDDLEVNEAWTLVSEVNQTLRGLNASEIDFMNVLDNFKIKINLVSSSINLLMINLGNINVGVIPRIENSITTNPVAIIQEGGSKEIEMIPFESIPQQTVNVWSQTIHYTTY